MPIDKKLRVLVVDDSMLARSLIINGLSTHPRIEVVGYAINALDAKRKRVRQLDDGFWALGCRTWQIIFTADRAAKKVKVLEIRSNYAADELAEGAEDRYADKDVHRKFIRKTF